MDPSSFLGPRGGELALSAFFAGAAVAGWMWKFIVQPLKVERDDAIKELKQKLIDDLNELRAILANGRDRA